MAEAAYEVELSKAVAKQLRKLDRVSRERIVKALSLLRTNPRPPAARALTGHPGYLRIRVGQYRVVYTVDDGKLTVLVLAADPRRDVYRSLPG